MEPFQPHFKADDFNRESILAYGEEHGFSHKQQVRALKNSHRYIAHMCPRLFYTMTARDSTLYDLEKLKARRDRKRLKAGHALVGDQSGTLQSPVAVQLPHPPSPLGHPEEP